MSNIFAKENYKPNRKIIKPMMVIYGQPGIGKSTFCAGFPNPFFFDFDNRTSHISGITRDIDYGIGINQLKDIDHLINIVDELAVTEYKTIIFDGVMALQNFITKDVTDGNEMNWTKYGIAKRGFCKLMEAAMNLQRNYEKTIIFLDHEKSRPEETTKLKAMNLENLNLEKIGPECASGILKTLRTSCDFVFRMVDHIEIKRDKFKGNQALHKGRLLLTDPTKNVECYLKTSLPLPEKMPATYKDFVEEWKIAYRKVHSITKMVEASQQDNSLPDNVVPLPVDNIRENEQIAEVG
jgi:hypothetical protein